MTSFRSSLPDSLRSTIKKEVVIMKTSGKAAETKKAAEVYNTEIIFSRVMYLLSADQIQIKDLFTYELSPVPTALFKDIGEGRSKSSKAVLKNALTKVSVRNIFPDAILIDGCAMLHSAIHWPKGGKVEDLLAGLRSYISKKLLKSDVYLIFDRYKEFSIKSDTRQKKVGSIPLYSHLKQDKSTSSKRGHLADYQNKNATY